MKSAIFIEKKMKVYALFFLLSLPVFSFSQSFEWIKAFPFDYTTNIDMVNHCVSVDSNEQIFYGGLFMFHENYAGAAYGDLFIREHDEAGNSLFTFYAYGKGNIVSMKHDNEDNLILIIDIRENLLLDSSDTLYHTGNSVSSHLLKLSPGFDFLWSKTIANDFSYSYAKGIAFDLDNNIYYGTDDFQESKIVILNPNGEEVTQIIQENVGVISSIAVDDQGNIYSAGSCAGTDATFGGVLFENNLSYNIYIAKYNNQYEVQWVNFAEDITCPMPKVLASDPDHIYLVGDLFNNTMFGNIAVNGPDWVYDYFVARLNSSGAFEWVNEIPESTPITGDGSLGRLESCVLDSENNLYLTGFIRGDINWDNGMTTNSTNISYDLLVVKYNPVGELIMTKHGGGESYDKANSVAISEDGDLYISGYGFGVVQYDTVYADFEGFYPILVKLNNDDNTTGIADFELASTINVYPNPAFDIVNINLANFESEINFITIQDLNGSMIEELEVTNKRQVEIDLTALQTGVYILTIHTENNKLYHKKILKF